MLYIVKVVCLLHKSGKHGYVVHIKTSMFTTEKNGKNEYVVCIKTSILIMEITGMLYIRHHKIRFLRVLHRERDNAK